MVFKAKIFSKKLKIILKNRIFYQKINKNNRVSKTTTLLTSVN